MPRRVTIPFIGGTAKARSIAVNNQETVNFMQSVHGGGAKGPIILEPTPGTVDLGAIGDGVCRSPQMVNWGGRGTDDLYGVFGLELEAMTLLSGVQNIGTLQNNPLSQKVRIARGRNDLALVDGTDGYFYDGTTFLQITDVDFPGQSGRPNGLPTHILYMDGFFIVNDADTDDFLISAKEDASSWNPLDFEAAAVAPDNSLALANTESILYIMGDETTQLYYNSGNPDFPYSIILNATQEVGILAPQSIAETDDGVFFVGTTPEGGSFVYRIQGQSGETISLEEQDNDLGEAANITTAYGFMYKQRGKSFYVLQIDDGLASSQTLVYNVRAKSWETRALLDGTGWRINAHGMLGTDNIGGSRIAGRRYRLDLGVFTDAGATEVRRRRTQIYHQDNHLMDWWQVVIDIEGGVGNQNPPGDDPTIRLRYSNDNGNTWSSKLSAPMGKIGEFDRRAVFNQLGQARNRVFEIEVSDPVRMAITNAYAYVTIADD